MLPNFFIVGTQKGGTTSLQHYLEDHPDIYLPAQKETKFFVDDDRFNKGVDFYKAEYFSACAGEKAVGEIDPDYMYFEQALQRIAATVNIGTLKFVFSLRNPIDRAFSHYLMSYRRGVEPLTFEEAITQEGHRIKKDYLSNMHFSYTGRGKYFDQISRYLEYVDRSQMYFVLFDDLIENPNKFLKDIFNFLEVDVNYTPKNIGKKFHPATAPRSMKLLKKIKKKEAGIGKKIARLLIPWKTARHGIRQKLLQYNQTASLTMSMSNSTRQRLLEFYKHDNARLAGLIGRDLSCWEK